MGGSSNTTTTTTSGGGGTRNGGKDKDKGKDSPAAFMEGDRVLAYHGPLLYEAKVQKTENREDEWRYFVHYLGWNKNWDEWVPSDRLLKFNEENVRKQHELHKNQTVDKTIKSGRAAQHNPKGSNDAKTNKEDNKGAVKGKKRKNQLGTEEKERRSSESLLMSQFPLTLKKQLVDDWEFVTQLGKLILKIGIWITVVEILYPSSIKSPLEDGKVTALDMDLKSLLLENYDDILHCRHAKLVKLPRSPTVDDILKKYLEHRIKKDNKISDSYAEITRGLRCYFDKALPAMLLYKKEQKQYKEEIKGDVSPSTVYGAEHLLRLFVKLPELLASVSMEEDALNKLQQKLLDILKFLQKNQVSFFLSVYDGDLKGADAVKGK